MERSAAGGHFNSQFSSEEESFLRLSSASPNQTLRLPKIYSGAQDDRCKGLPAYKTALQSMKTPSHGHVHRRDSRFALVLAPPTLEPAFLAPWTSCGQHRTLHLVAPLKYGTIYGL